MWTVANAVMGLLFVTSAALQWNDPDPAQWVALYLAAATACVLPGRSRAGPALAGLTGAVALVWAAFLLPHVWGVVAPGDLFEGMQAKNGLVEVGREAGGLTIVAAWMAALLARAKLGARRASPEGKGA